MDPYDVFHGAEPRRYLRFVYEFEIEVTDPLQAKVAAWGLAQNEEGELGMMVTNSNQNAQVADAVSEVVSGSLSSLGQQAGFRWMGGSLLPRPVNDQGQHGEMTIPAMPARQDDGTFPEGSFGSQP
jgi:hypothetical protein